MPDRALPNETKMAHGQKNVPCSLEIKLHFKSQMCLSVSNRRELALWMERRLHSVPSVRVTLANHGYLRVRICRRGQIALSPDWPAEAQFEKIRWLHASWRKHVLAFTSTGWWLPCCEKRGGGNGSWLKVRGQISSVNYILYHRCVSENRKKTEKSYES